MSSLRMSLPPLLFFLLLNQSQPRFLVRLRDNLSEYRFKVPSVVNLENPKHASFRLVEQSLVLSVGVWIRHQNQKALESALVSPEHPRSDTKLTFGRSQPSNQRQRNFIGSRPSEFPIGSVGCSSQFDNDGAQRVCFIRCDHVQIVHDGAVSQVNVVWTDIHNGLARRFGIEPFVSAEMSLGVFDMNHCETRAYRSEIKLAQRSLSGLTISDPIGEIDSARLDERVHTSQVRLIFSKQPAHRNLVQQLGDFSQVLPLHHRDDALDNLERFRRPEQVILNSGPVSPVCFDSKSVSFWIRT